jgi:hypothetical protein
MPLPDQERPDRRRKTMDNGDRLRAARIAIVRHMYESGKDVAEIASQLHPDLAAEDIRRFLAGAEPVCEDERVLSSESILLKFAQLLR